MSEMAASGGVLVLVPPVLDASYQQEPALSVSVGRRRRRRVSAKRMPLAGCALAAFSPSGAG